MWVDYNFTFALRKDGSLYLWQAKIYREWAVVLLFFGVCGGAIALFVPVLVLVLLLGLRDWRANRARKTPEEKMSANLVLVLIEPGYPAVLL